MRSRWRLFIGIAVSIFFLGLVLRNLQLQEFMIALRTADYRWLVPAVGVYFLAVWARTWRWHYMLRHIEEVPMGRLFRVLCIGYMGNNIYPARAGEFLRSYMLKQETATHGQSDGVPMSASMATIGVERIFDGMVMIAFVFFALPLVEFEGDIVSEYGLLVTLTTLLFIGALAAALTLAARPAFTRNLYGRVVHASVPEEHRGTVLGVMERFMLGLEGLAKGREVIIIFGISVVVWLFETMKYWFVMHAFPFEVSFATLMLVNGIVNLATTIPALPGYLGTFDLPAIRILTAAGVERSLATAYTLVLHVALWLPITVLGAFFLWRSHISLSQARAMASEPTAPEAATTS